MRRQGAGGKRDERHDSDKYSIVNRALEAQQRFEESELQSESEVADCRNSIEALTKRCEEANSAIAALETEQNALHALGDLKLYKQYSMTVKQRGASFNIVLPRYYRSHLIERREKLQALFFDFLSIDVLREKFGKQEKSDYKHTVSSKPGSSQADPNKVWLAEDLTSEWDRMTCSKDYQKMQSLSHSLWDAIGEYANDESGVKSGGHESGIKNAISDFKQIDLYVLARWSDKGRDATLYKDTEHDSQGDWDTFKRIDNIKRRWDKLLDEIKMNSVARAKVDHLVGILLQGGRLAYADLHAQVTQTCADGWSLFSGLTAKKSESDYQIKFDLDRSRFSCDKERESHKRLRISEADERSRRFHAIVGKWKEGASLDQQHDDRIAAFLSMNDGEAVQLPESVWQAELEGIFSEASLSWHQRIKKHALFSVLLSISLPHVCDSDSLTSDDDKVTILCVLTGWERSKLASLKEDLRNAQATLTKRGEKLGSNEEKKYKLSEKLQALCLQQAISNWDNQQVKEIHSLLNPPLVLAWRQLYFRYLFYCKSESILSHGEKRTTDKVSSDSGQEKWIAVIKDELQIYIDTELAKRQAQLISMSDSGITSIQNRMKEGFLCWPQLSAKQKQRFEKLIDEGNEADFLAELSCKRSIFRNKFTSFVNHCRKSLRDDFSDKDIEALMSVHLGLPYELFSEQLRQDFRARFRVKVLVIEEQFADRFFEELRVIWHDFFMQFDRDKQHQLIDYVWRYTGFDLEGYDSYFSRIHTGSRISDASITGVNFINAKETRMAELKRQEITDLLRNKIESELIALWRNDDRRFFCDQISLICSRYLSSLKRDHDRLKWQEMRGYLHYYLFSSMDLSHAIPEWVKQDRLSATGRVDDDELAGLVRRDREISRAKSNLLSPFIQTGECGVDQFKGIDSRVSFTTHGVKKCTNKVAQCIEGLKEERDLREKNRSDKQAELNAVLSKRSQTPSEAENLHMLLQWVVSQSAREYAKINPAPCYFSCLAWFCELFRAHGRKGRERMYRVTSSVLKTSRFSDAANVISQALTRDCSLKRQTSYGCLLYSNLYYATALNTEEQIAVMQQVETAKGGIEKLRLSAGTKERTALVEDIVDQAVGDEGNIVLSPKKTTWRSGLFGGGLKHTVLHSVNETLDQMRDPAAAA